MIHGRINTAPTPDSIYGTAYVDPGKYAESLVFLKFSKQGIYTFCVTSHGIVIHKSFGFGTSYSLRGSMSLKVAIINIPFKTWINGHEEWITVPPQGYGGIQWMVATHIEALVALKHEIVLIGAPGSSSWGGAVDVLKLATRDEIRGWIETNSVDVVHDFSNGSVFSPSWIAGESKNMAWVSTHHFTGVPENPVNAIYVSHAQARQGRSVDGNVIRIPVNVNRYTFSDVKENYLLFLGRVSAWKGAYEAARFADLSDIPLIIAGPSWEPEYAESIRNDFGHNTTFLGEVGGKQRLDLLAHAKALLVMSQSVLGPWGDVWCEPGSTVVGEAAASGTPVISTDNGCLAEISPLVGKVVSSTEEISRKRAEAIINSLPSSAEVRSEALRNWDYVKIAKEYEAYYERAINGQTWR